MKGRQRKVQVSVFYVRHIESRASIIPTNVCSNIPGARLQACLVSLVTNVFVFWTVALLLRPPRCNTS